MDSIKNYSNKLRELRGEKTLECVERETGIKRTALSNYENGIRVPRDEFKIVLANYYNTTVQDIFFTEQCH